MTRLILIRHGESEANLGRCFAGQIDPDLTPKGRKQAELTAKNVFENFKTDRIYSSDLKRAYNTALALSEVTGLKVEKNKELREINAGQWEGKKFDDIMNLYPEEFGEWLNHIGRAECPDGESVVQIGKRVISALTEIARENDGKTVAVATHATPIRSAHSIMQFGSVEGMENIPWVSNASVSVFEYDNDTWNVVAVSIDEHLSELITVLPDNV